MKNPVSTGTTFLLILIILILNFLYPPRIVLAWDVFGYYLYLPLTFIYHDLRLENTDVVYALYEKYQVSSTLYQAFPSADGGWVLKYSMGMALMYLPFFFIGHITALLSHFPTDGFSLPYQKAIWAGGLIYTVISLVLLRKILLRFFADRTTALVMVVVVLGTNYLFSVYYVGQNANPQNYVFAFYALIVWFTIRWHETRSTKHALLLALFCGLNILSRPTEMVCLILPFLWGVQDRESLSAKLRLLSENRKQLLMFFLVLVAIGSLQFAYWKASSGHFLYYSYGNRGGEGLDLLRPNLFRVLFSFRKGWLVYTPVMILALLGFRSLYRKNRPLFYPILFYFLMNLYLVSCWSTWWYADSYGQRALIPSYVLLSLPLGYLFLGLQEDRKKWKVPVLLLAFALTGLNLFQTWQFSEGIIHPSRMTRKYYFRAFGRTGVSESDRKLLLVSREEWPVEHVPDERDYRRARLYFNALADNGRGDADTLMYFRMDSTVRFTPAFKKPFREMTRKGHVYIRASAEVFVPSGHRGETPLMVMAFDHRGKLYKYNTTGLQPGDIRYDAWNPISMDYLSPEIRSKKDRLNVYLWYRGEDHVLVRNMEIILFDPLERKR